MNGVDLTLCVIVDYDVEKFYPVERFTEDVILGGATCLQIRCKTDTATRTLDLARRVLAVAADYNIPVIVNDRMDIALAAGARGVHLGEDDLPVAEVRRVVSRTMIIGASARDLATARAAAAHGADYLGVGPVFATPVKPDVKPIAPGTIAEVRREISLPILAIGGINETNAAIPVGEGADGIAVISALRQCSSPREVAARLRLAIRQARKR